MEKKQKTQSKKELKKEKVSVWNQLRRKSKHSPNTRQQRNIDIYNWKDQRERERDWHE